MNQVLSISDMKEKKIGLGEDSDPIFLNQDSFVVVGVLDGMGGAGGAECDSDFGASHTKAYVASRIIKDAIEKGLRQLTNLPDSSDLKNFLEELISNRYEEERLNHPPKSKGGLRSSLIKEYPTTLAMVCISMDKDKYIVDSLWAGDSRNYIWNINGLFQISVDDLKGGLDPLQNLYEDAPMSNCLQADAPIIINLKRIELPTRDKFIILSATDGCFGYYPSPMDFEKILFDCLKNADTLDEWKEKLNHAFEYVTADDFSFSIAAFGFNQFKELKKFLSHSPKGSLARYFQKRSDFECKVRKRNKLNEVIAEIETQLESEIKELWPTYKQTYLKYMHTNEEG